jgi:BirA family biotin operon repressor/biotin-[acetyl-CoA-carboxylase] ligase
MKLGAPRIDLDECGSTNDELAARASAGAAAGTLVTARRQRTGRGRSGRPWHSPEGNLYMSLLLRPSLEAAAVPPLSLVAGIAVCRAARALGAAAQLKWPNDVVVGSRKLGGILVESSSRAGRVEHVIVGVGVNVAARGFPDELAETATSLAIERGEAPATEEVLERILGELEAPLAEYLAGGVAAIAPAWLALARDLRRPAVATIGNERVRGRVIGLTASGALEIETASGERRAVVAGPVEIE